MPGKRPRFLSVLLILLVGAGLLVWWVNALTNEDALWFLRSFSAQADWIIIYCDGNTSMIFPGDPAYEAIMADFAAGVAHATGFEEDAELSDESLESYRTRQRMVELHFNTPARVHTRHPFRDATCYWVPLDGVHAEQRRVFGGLNEHPRTGVLTMSVNRFEQLRQTVEQSLAQSGPES